MTPGAFRCAAGVCTTRRSGGCPQSTRQDEEVRPFGGVSRLAEPARRLAGYLVRAGDRKVDAASPRMNARSACTTFNGVLFEKPENGIRDTVEPPDFFVDLNLDQIIGAVTAGREEYNLKPFFYTPLGDIGATQYRHEIMQDLENAAVSAW